MKLLNSIAVYDNDECFIALLKGYCYANNITMTEFDFNSDGFNELEKINPALIVVPLDLVSTVNKNLETGSLRRACGNCQVKICGVKKNSSDNFSTGLAGGVDIIINNPYDIGEIDKYLKKIFLFNSYLTEKRRNGERRSDADRRNIEFNNKINHNGDNRNKVTGNPGYQHKAGNPGFQDFEIDYRNRCVLLKGQKVDLTPKEFELVELLLTDVDRIFMNEEIINHLWPQSNRATKSDLYQYMHLLRKKIETDPNNPQWIMTVKGFGYKLNVGNA